MQTVRFPPVRSEQLQNVKSSSAKTSRKQKSADCNGTSFLYGAYSSKTALVSGVDSGSYSTSVSSGPSSYTGSAFVSGPASGNGDSARTAMGTAKTEAFVAKNALNAPDSATEKAAPAPSSTNCAPVTFARAPSDSMEEFSARLTGYPASKGRLLTCLKAYALLGREGCVQIARGKLQPPPETAACRAVLASLVAPAGTPRAQVKEATHARLSPPAPTAYGTAADAEVRGVYAHVLAFVLQQMIQANDVLGLQSVNTNFSCPVEKAPSISLLMFVERMMRFLPATKELYIVALIYLDRIVALDPEIALTLYNVHRLFISAVHVASKFLDDLFYSTSFVARVAGVPTDELNRLEIEFLAAIRFSLCVDPSLFATYAVPFLQLVGVCRIFPLDARIDAPPYAGPSLLRSSYTVVDELFIHIQDERLLYEPSRRLCEPPRRSRRTCTSSNDPASVPHARATRLLDDDDSSSSASSTPSSDASSASDSSPAPHQRPRPRSTAPAPARIVVTVSAPGAAPVPLSEKPVALKRLSPPSSVRA